MRQQQLCCNVFRQHNRSLGIAARWNHTSATGLQFAFQENGTSRKPASASTTRWRSFFLDNAKALQWPDALMAAGASTVKKTRASSRKQDAIASDPLPTADAIQPSLQTTLGNKQPAFLLDAGFKEVSRSHSASDLYKLYKGLSKARLSGWIVLTAMAGYAMCPFDPAAAASATDAFLTSLPGALNAGSLEAITPNLPKNTLSMPILLSTTIGTLLCSASANTLNQLSEIPYDAQMARTRNRVLVRRALTPLHATVFAGASGIIGVGTLAAFVNPLVASLGLANIILYAFVYTPLKRISIVNTWIGAVVGGIPPLMGWAACTGTLDLATQPGAWAMFGLLFAWQFPHFNALAHSMRHDYAKTGYFMMASTNPDLNARVALRYSLAFFPICAAFPALGLTSSWFAILSAIPNGLLTWASFRFWWDPQRRGKHARILFWASLAHLPVLLVMMMMFKEGAPWMPVRTEEVAKD